MLRKSAKYGYIICDNQLANNPIFTLLNYDGFSTIPIPEYAWDTIAKIRTNIFEFIAQESQNSYVLTNVLNEDEGDRKLYNQVEQMAAKRGSLFIPVKLLISEEEQLKRITISSRRTRWKSIDPQDVYSKDVLITIEHQNLLELDVSPMAAQQAANLILEHIENIKMNEHRSEGNKSTIYCQLANQSNLKPHIRTMQLYNIKNNSCLEFLSRTDTQKWTDWQLHPYAALCFLNVDFGQILAEGEVILKTLKTHPQEIKDYWYSLKPDIKMIYTEEQEVPECLGIISIMPNLWEVIEFSKDRYLESSRMLYKLINNSWSEEKIKIIS